jgi:hypothetical protein
MRLVLAWSLVGIHALPHMHQTSRVQTALVELVEGSFKGEELRGSDAILDLAVDFVCALTHFAESHNISTPNLWV